MSATEKIKVIASTSVTHVGDFSIITWEDGSTWIHSFAFLFGDTAAAHIELSAEDLQALKEALK